MHFKGCSIAVTLKASCKSCVNCLMLNNKYLLQTLPSVTCKSKLLCHALFSEQFLGLFQAFGCFGMLTRKSEVGGTDELSAVPGNQILFFLYPSVQWSLPKWWDMWVLALWNICTARMAASTFWSWIPACKWSTPAQRWWLMSICLQRSSRWVKCPGPGSWRLSEVLKLYEEAQAWKTCSAEGLIKQGGGLLSESEFCVKTRSHTHTAD